MENNTSGGNGPELQRTSPQHGSASDDMFSPEVSPTTPVGLPDLKELLTYQWTRYPHFRVQVSVTYDMRMTFTQRPKLMTRSRK